MARACARLAPGAVIAIVNPDCSNISEDSWALIADLSDKSELHVFCAGTRLPGLGAAEATSYVRALILLGKETGDDDHLGVAFTKSVFALKEALSADPTPCELLEDMSAAAHALGRGGLALAYAAAAVRLLWIEPRLRSAVYLAAALRGRGHILAACKCMARVCPTPCTRASIACRLLAAKPL